MIFSSSQIFSSNPTFELFQETTLEEIGHVDDFDCLGSCPRHHMSTYFGMVIVDFDISENVAWAEK